MGVKVTVTTLAVWTAVAVKVVSETTASDAGGEAIIVPPAVRMMMLTFWKAAMPLRIRAAPNTDLAFVDLPYDVHAVRSAAVRVPDHAFAMSLRYAR